MSRLHISVIGAAFSVGLLAACGATPSGGAPIPATSDTPQAAGSSQPAASAPAKPVVLLTAKGNGIKTLKAFTTTGDWTLSYTYNCTSFGFKGNFMVTDEGDNFDVLVNELGMKGADKTNPSSTGKVKLSVNSECAWTVKATQP